MRAKEFISESQQPKLYVDNPGGEWLQYKIDYAKKKGPNQYGKPHMDSVTGYFDQPVYIPVSILKDIPGARNEQANVRHDDLTGLVDYMKTSGHLPLMNNGKEYVPFIVIGYDGVPWVSEGNHRIMAASMLGWEKLPVEIRYFDGGESIDGILNPTKLKSM